MTLYPNSLLAVLSPFVRTMSTSSTQATSDQSSEPSLTSKLTTAASHVADKVLHTTTMPASSPITKIGLHLCALHAYHDQPERQIVAHHYCSHVSAEKHQCVLYESAEPGARLIGVEYLISRRLFEQLPAEEQQYWHTHKFEVFSGMLVTPELPELAERQVVAQIANMFGKIYQLWDLDNALPIGPPRLMTSVTADKYVDKAVLNLHEQQTNISSEERAKLRQNLTYEITDHNKGEADSWERGKRITWVRKDLDIDK